MGTAAIIVLGVVAITVIGIVGDMVTKIAQAKIKGRAAAAPQEEIEGLHRRINALESRVEERDESVRKLQEELRFVSRILEDKSGGQGRA